MVEFAKGDAVVVRGRVFGRAATGSGVLIGVDIGGARNLWLPPEEICLQDSGAPVVDSGGFTPHPCPSRDFSRNHCPARGEGG